MGDPPMDNSPVPMDDLPPEAGDDHDAPIPLCEEAPSGSIIFPSPRAEPSASTVRGRRVSPRKSFERVWVLFSPEVRPGEIDHTECPIIDISAGGAAVQYDQLLKNDIKGYICYRSVCDMPIRIGFSVRRCVERDGGYLIGVQFDRKLRYEDRRPARIPPGREIVPGIRARRLAASTATIGHPAQCPPPSALGTMTRIEPSDEGDQLDLAPLPD